MNKTIKFIIRQLLVVDLDSDDFRNLIINRVPYVDHFLHEFRSYARSPYELDEYDRRCDYHRYVLLFLFNYIL